MGLLEHIDKLITERGSAAIMGKHLDLLRDQAQALENQVADLQRENAALEDRVAELEAQVASAVAREEFVEHHGAFFKRKPGGGYHEAVFCPSCHGPMSSLQGMLPYVCQRCSTVLDFTSRDLEGIMRCLPGQ
jgi:hypothetical protein